MSRTPTVEQEADRRTPVVRPVARMPDGPLGLYDPRDEHEACGVGFVAAIDGRPSRAVVEAALDALRAIWHRGAVDADGKTGDGAGIHIAIPQDFFKRHAEGSGHRVLDGPIAVGQVFLPRTDLAAQERCRMIVEREITAAGLRIYGWRQVPVDTSVIGRKAEAARPEIEQIMLGDPRGRPIEEYERLLYLVRRRIEKAVAESQLADFYICSLSARSVIYKGLFLAEQLSVFYPDLADERFVSAFALYHQRYSTNTFPQWWLAQPFRTLAHNGEINTLRGNLNWMRSHEIRMAGIAFGEREEDIKPVVPEGASDSAALDAVFELLVRAGRSAPMAKTLLIPDSWSKDASMPEAHRAMYAYCNSVMEPWDGPAAIVAFDGRYVIAGMDRNGLRPLRYCRTEDGLVIVGSEAGMVPVEEERIVEKGRVGPGQMIAVDLEEGRFHHDREIKDELAASQPFAEWVRHFRDDRAVLEHAGDEEPVLIADERERRRRARLAAIDFEAIELVLRPQAETGKEAIGSMGDDSPLAVLAPGYRPLAHFFRQRFSQVTNPPIDPLREARVMSLKTRFANFSNVLDADNPQDRVLTLDSPVLTSRMYEALMRYWGDEAAVIDCSFPADAPPGALAQALRRIRHEAEDAVRSGRGQIFLTDERAGAQRVPVPMILAVGGVHTHLLDQGLRTFASINVRAADCVDSHALAVLIGVGATTVSPWLVQDLLSARFGPARVPGGADGAQVDAAWLQRWKKALEDGLLKIMSKMGISVVSSYRGGANFEALGLARALVAEFFPAMPCKISGVGLESIETALRRQHEAAFADTSVHALTAAGGFYRWRARGEPHGLTGPVIEALQRACDSGASAAYRDYVALLERRPAIDLRDLLDFVPADQPLEIDEVESVTALRKRFVTPGMSLGALSPEAHETLAIAMNRIGAKSVSGEGGEDPRRFRPYPNGDNANSPVKQVASGRFGVTAEYLNNAEEIEIKIAQGAKPGEGGQLPGFKVTGTIARLRHSTPGVTLISPPPHHDIYSIEDLAQLIYDLKQINPTARVGVKLVSAAGIGTIAAGVAKAHADVITVSGHSGGTGASPLTSIKFAGTPWEIGLAEVHQVLTLNGLRGRVRLRVDGGIRSGRDIVIGALLGAEEFGIGTASLLALGCLMVRQCHTNRCPVGICTQDEALRGKFTGHAEKVINLMTFLAEDVRERLARLGARSLQEIVGRADLLTQVRRGAGRIDDLDLNPLLVRVESARKGAGCTIEGRNPVPDTLDAQMVKDALPVFERGEKMQLSYIVRNTHRAVGTRFSSALVRRFGPDGLDEGHVTVQLKGSAGQSLGAFAVRGLKLVVFGEANDYVAKGLSGATVVVRPPARSRLLAHENVIIGNTVLYGATSGALFAAGQAGERFAVRNSGAIAVVEGVGDNGCEYMTGGCVAILGPVGDNFAAGMTGGIAYVLDEDDRLDAVLNPDSVVVGPVEAPEDVARLRDLLERHLAETGSVKAALLLDDFETAVKRFRRVAGADEERLRGAAGEDGQPVRALAG